MMPIRRPLSDGSVIGAIGNPNCRIKVKQPIPEFFDQWCQQTPSHHMAVGAGDLSAQIESSAERMNFPTARI